MRPYKPPESGGMAITSLPDLVLSQLSGLIAARMGWHFPADRWADLERGIRAVARDLGFSDVQGCIDWLHSAPLTQQQVDVLTDHFTLQPDLQYILHPGGNSARRDAVLLLVRLSASF